MAIPQDHIRNFCIIAHIDHGKSTLADRLLELTDSVSSREMEDQLLDSMDLERERGITIKSHAVTLYYTASDGEQYELNLIDTPGHVDFNYEVSRSLAACEGAVLVVDASQGIEAQTLANTYLAVDHGLELLPVINKIDLPSADADRVASEIEDIIGIPGMDAPRISAKNGINIPEVLERIVTDIPAPEGDPEAPLSALIFDSIYDPYKGVIVYFRVMSGTIRPGDAIKMMATGAEFDVVVEVGRKSALALVPCQELRAGEVGYLSASIKTVSQARVGDTITHRDRPAPEPLAGYRQVNPVVFCGIYPADGAQYQDLKEALEKLQINDASLLFEAETSQALGFGFRCGFLGLLHMEIIEERLEREYNLDLITTAPSVIYKFDLSDGSQMQVDNPTNYPDPATIVSAQEPIADVHIYSPSEFVGTIMDLCQERRGEYKDMQYMGDRVDIHYILPVNEIVYDFFDALKSRTRGYASYDYEMKGYQTSKLVKLDVLLNGDMVDALSFIVHADNAYKRARRIAEKLKKYIPRQLFEIPVQVAVGGKVIARETVKAMRKDVLAKCYGGDITRKKKLLEKQKEGKKKMRSLGTVEVPQEAFMAVLKLDDDDQ